MPSRSDIAGRMEDMRKDLAEKIGSRSPKDMQDMSHEQRVNLTREIANDNLKGIAEVTVRHMGTFDRVLVTLAERYRKVDK